PWPASVLAKILTGSRDPMITRWERLSTYGILSGFTAAEVEQVLSELERAGALQREAKTRPVGGRERTFAVLGLTDLGRDVMLKRATGFRMYFPLGQRALKTRPPHHGGGGGAPRHVAADLLLVLRDVRARLAKAADVPAYAVAPNRTLEDMASRRPMTRTAMMEVHGMGPERFRKYGQEFLDAMRGWAGH
ncbi:MAG: HRDC domain-containing protein, partial [Myxococcota bacterium]